MTEDRLARALSGWGAWRRLDERERERMRTAILLTPEVNALWWDQFNHQMARLTVRAQRPARDRPAPIEWGEPARVGWGAGA